MTLKFKKGNLTDALGENNILENVMTFKKNSLPWCRKCKHISVAR